MCIRDRFISEFEFAKFNHGSALIAGLRSGDILPYSAPHGTCLPTAHYLDIYEFRLQCLDERHESKRTEHMKSLRFDAADLCDGLRAHPTDTCELWSFTESPRFLYGVFVAHESRIILGCIRSVDNRMITPDLRNELWGESEKDSGG